MKLQSTPLTFKRFSYYKGKIMFLNIQILVRNVHRRLYNWNHVVCDCKASAESRLWFDVELKPDITDFCKISKAVMMPQKPVSNVLHSC